MMVVVAVVGHTPGVTGLQESQSTGPWEFQFAAIFFSIFGISFKLTKQRVEEYESQMTREKERLTDWVI